MATYETVLAALRQLGQTRSDSNKIKMEMGRSQGEALDRFGKSMNDMVDTWIAKGEASKKRDFEAGENQKQRLMMEDADLRGRLAKADEQQNKQVYDERMWDKEAQLRRDLAQKEKDWRLAGIGGKDKERDYASFDPYQLLVAEALANDSVRFDPDMNRTVVDYAKVSAKKQKIMEGIRDRLNQKLSANEINNEQYNSYYRYINRLIEEQAAPVPTDQGGGGGTPRVALTQQQQNEQNLVEKLIKQAPVTWGRLKSSFSSGYMTNDQKFKKIQETIDDEKKAKENTLSPTALNDYLSRLRFVLNNWVSSGNSIDMQ